MDRAGPTSSASTHWALHHQHSTSGAHDSWRESQREGESGAGVGSRLAPPPHPSYNPPRESIWGLNKHAPLPPSSPAAPPDQPRLAYEAQDPDVSTGDVAALPFAQDAHHLATRHLASTKTATRDPQCPFIEQTRSPHKASKGKGHRRARTLRTLLSRKHLRPRRSKLSEATCMRPPASATVSPPCAKVPPRRLLRHRTMGWRPRHHQPPTTTTAIITTLPRLTHPSPRPPITMASQSGLRPRTGMILVPSRP